jgi:alpha-beta hydrolase superfamily lysophospholipase
MLRIARKVGWTVFKYAAVMIATALVVVFLGRTYGAIQGPPLRPWHTFAPAELDDDTLAEATWEDYLAAEDAAFREVDENVVQHLAAQDELPANRYFAASPLYPPHFQTDWNRSFISMPQGEPKGAAVLLHGLTDSPYSVRHLARLYTDRGFVAVAIRLPGHGTVPGGLTSVTWHDWMAATKLAVREAVARVGAGKPLHIVGYSNGGALAVKYVLDTLYDDKLARPQRVVLFSPMIGVTAFARFAWLAGLPADLFPAAVKASWLDIVPEYNPFKYNSFPVNAAVQSYNLTVALQEEIEKAATQGRLKDMPPVLTFQSLVDFTINVHALATALYDKLPANGSELVLFDINRSRNLSLLMRSSAETVLSSLVRPAPRNFDLSVITNDGSSDGSVAEKLTTAGSTEETTRPLGMRFPPGVFSLSHIAMPFPPDDGLYGGFPAPRPTPEFGINLGTLDLRGENGVLVVSLDTAMRMSYNPFYPYVIDLIERGIGTPAN